MQGADNLGRQKSVQLLKESSVAKSFEMINGTPNYNLYIDGEWTRSLRNESTDSMNPATRSPPATALC